MRKAAFWVAYYLLMMMSCFDLATVGSALLAKKQRGRKEQRQPGESGIAAAAPIFVLVGNKVRDIFLEQALNDAERAQAKSCFCQKGIYAYTDEGGTERSVVCVEFGSGKMRRFHTYFPQTTLRDLKAAMNGPLKNPPA
jgi:hypothetical protein